MEQKWESRNKKYVPIDFQPAYHDHLTGKVYSFQQMELEQLNSHMQKDESISYVTSYTNINSKWV